MRVRRGLIVAVAALASLGLAYAIKDPCTDTPWENYFQYRHYCYSDVLPIWFGKHLDRDAVPYVEDFNEYPVLTGFFMYGVARVTEGLHSYMVLSFVLLLLAGGLSTLALWRIGMPFESLLVWSLAPTVPIHALTNWDLIPVALAAWGWHEWVKGRPFTAALLFGLGGSAKLYPAFFLPLLFLHRLRLRDRRGMAAVAGGGFLGLGVPNLAVIAATPSGWWATWKFQAERTPDFETPWQAFLEHYGRPLFPRFDWDATWSNWVGLIGFLVMVAALAWLARGVWKRGLDPLVAGGVLCVVFILVNKVYSPQYTLWILPILLLLRARPWPLLLFVAADAANFLVRYQLMSPAPGQTEGWNPAWEDWSRLAVNLRWAFLAWALWTILVHHGLLQRARSAGPDLPAEAPPEDAARPAGPEPAPPGETAATRAADGAAPSRNA